MNKIIFSVLFLLLLACVEKTSQGTKLASLWSTAPSIDGKAEYLSSPMLTAGNRIYMVGHQDGSFPELGWHIMGEMGGIWNHPIKLMDGFEATLSDKEGNLYPLQKAFKFVNYPFFNEHVYELPELQMEIERWQFVPDDREGLVVQYVFKNSGEERELNFQFIGYSDLRPTWLGERTQMHDGTDQATWNEQEQAWSVKDSLNPWYVHFGSSHTYLTYDSIDSDKYKGKGTSAHINYLLNIPKGESTITFTIAGSYQSEEAAWNTYHKLESDSESLFLSKKQRYQSLSKNSKLTIPDKELEQTFKWLKFNCDWLVRTVPEVGTGIGAGIPDYPWWFGVDSEYALQGYMMFGQREPVYKTIALLDSVSNAVNGNGRIIHEMSTNGAVFNPGNINETPQFASLIWKIYQWNGDKAFLERYFPTIEKGLDWLLSEKDTDGNGFPDGFGMMEIHGLDSEMIDVAAYTQKALSDASKMAAVLGNTALSENYAKKAAQLKSAINTDFWSEEFQSYADFIGNDQQALHLIDDAIVRADTLGKPWAVTELKQTKEKILKNPTSTNRPFVLHHNWVVNTPMEVGLADNDKALKALQTAEKFVNPFGVFVTGIDRDESAGKDDGSFKGSKVFSYTGAVMTLPTGVQAIAENNYGRPDQALDYLKRMSRSFSYALPGSMYEVSPDYGMMTQAWNAYSFAIPIVEQFFGIYPNAAERLIRIQPKLPTAWNEASLENVQIGNNQISIFIKKTEMEVTYKIVQSDTYELLVVLPSTSKNSINIIAGQGTVKSSEDGIQISSQSNTLEIAISNE